MADDSREMLERYRAGDATAADAILAQYTERLLALARSRLSTKLARRFDAEDVLQSAYRSFFVRAREGAFHLEREGDLWRLLATITLHKLGRQAARHKAAKRSPGRESAHDKNDALVMELASREPMAADVIAAADELSWLMSQLEPIKRQALELRLQEHALHEIAHRLGRSERTLRRWFGEAHELLTQRWAEQLERTRSDLQTRCPPAISNPQVTLQHNDYRLEQLIGTGGMCKVYRAIEKNTGRLVAIKVLRKRLWQSPSFVERFLSEAQMVAQLSHPHIVPIAGCGHFPGGGYFMVMDYVDGGDLAAACAQGPLPPAQAAQIVATVADAIQHAHDCGVIHRDLKPGNVLIDRAGTVFVTDFGFAWWEQAESRSEHAVVGTASFMAPEQVERRWGEIGPRTDVYGLGGLLLMLITGRPPASGSTTSEVLHNVVTPRADAVSTAAISSMPPTLRAVCERCLRQDPKQRYATAREVAAVLRSVVPSG